MKPDRECLMCGAVHPFKEMDRRYHKEWNKHVYVCMPCVEKEAIRLNLGVSNRMAEEAEEMRKKHGPSENTPWWEKEGQWWEKK